MENEKTFGRFLISKRQENEISARQLAIALDYSAVYICDIEKDRRPVPDEILERLPTLLHTKANPPICCGEWRAEK